MSTIDQTGATFEQLRQKFYESLQELGIEPTEVRPSDEFESDLGVAQTELVQALYRFGQEMGLDITVEDVRELTAKEGLSVADMDTYLRDRLIDLE